MNLLDQRSSFFTGQITSVTQSTVEYGITEGSSLRAEVQPTLELSAETSQWSSKVK